MGKTETARELRERLRHDVAITWPDSGFNYLIKMLDVEQIYQLARIADALENLVEAAFDSRVGFGEK